MFHCKNCDYKVDADFVSAQNILRRYLFVQEYMTPERTEIPRGCYDG